MPGTDEEEVSFTDKHGVCTGTPNKKKKKLQACGLLEAHWELGNPVYSDVPDYHCCPSACTHTAIQLWLPTWVPDGKASTCQQCSWLQAFCGVMHTNTHAHIYCVAEWGAVIAPHICALTLAGLEPAIFGSEDQHLIH